MKRRSALLGTGSMLAGAWLAGCGGGSGPDSGGPRLRLVHASVGHGPLDLYLDNDRRTTDLAYGSAGGYRAVDSDVRVEITPAGSASVLATLTPSLADKDYSLVAWGWAGGLRTQLLADDGAEPDSGRFRVRVLHAAPDAGTLDVFFTADSEPLDTATPLVAGLEGSTLSGYAQRIAGTWRIRVTGASDITDLRLDLAGLALARDKVYTLVLVSGVGGVLTSAVLLTQGGEVLNLPNPSARVRLVASVADLATVDARVDGSVLGTGLTSPALGGYQLLPAGTHTVAATVNGVETLLPGRSFDAGGDHTVLVTGPAASPQVVVLADDNRRPTLSTHAKIRLLHAAVPLAAADASMTVDLAAAGTAAFATASAYVMVAASSTASVEASSPLASSPVFSATDQVLAANGVYTLFLLTSGSQVQASLRAEL